MNESLKVMDKSHTPASLGLHNHSLDLKPIHLDTKLQFLVTQAIDKR